MALTDTRPETGTDATSVAPSVVPSPLTIFGSGDHKAVGTFYVLAALVFGIAGWIATALASANTVGSSSFLSETAGTQVLQTSQIGLILLVIVPLFLGLATYIVPLQVGASTVAFPRAAAAAMWTWLLSSGVFVVASFIEGGFGGVRAKSVSLTLLALGGLIVALLLGTVCVLTTAITLRTPGMTLDRVPMFTFSMLVGGAIWMLTLPVLFANLLLIWVDHRYGGGTVFGASEAQFGQVSWITHQPQIYAFLIPGLGIVADVVATLTGARLGKRNLLLTAIGAFGVLSVGAWAQPAIYPSFSEDLVWQAMGLLVLLPLLLLLGGIATAFKDGKPSLKSPLGLAVVSIVLTLLGVFAGALLVITPLELRTTNFFANGQAILVLGAALAAGAAGIGYWGPKMTGGHLADGIGKLNVLVMLGGGILGGVSLCVVGFATRFSGLSSAQDTLVVISVAGSALFAIGCLLVILGLVSGARKGAPEAGNDAWGTGQTLEWACPSPPPTGNFGDLAVVRSPEPLLDEEA
jgi:heme/copper-type cytochrome/quinol oxidase subunit 1